VHQREERALGPEDGELEDIAVASAPGGCLAALGKAGAAFFLHAAVGHHKMPMVQQPGAIEQAAFEQITEHEHGDLGHQLRVHAAGVAGRVIRASDPGLARKARIFGRLAAEGAQVPGRCSGLPLLIEAVARALAGEKGGQDVPPEVGGRIDAHRLRPRVGQAVEPGVETGKRRPHHPHQGLRG
jgi:hypothetical protein